MLGVAVLGGVLLVGLSAGGGSVGGGRVRESVVEAHLGATRRLVRIPARGVLIEGSSGMGDGPGLTGPLREMLERAAEDTRVAGVLIELDTPGGSVTDSDQLHAQMGKLRDAGKKVHVLMGDLCASGGVYLAVGAERVQALPTTVTGSIGVMISGLNVAGLMARYGVEDTSVTSGPNKAMMSPTRAVEPEHQRILQGIVDAMYDRFVKLVSEGRKLPLERVKAFADGRLLTADEALAAGLVDAVGYADAAMDALREAAGEGPFEVVRYDVEPSLFELLKARAAPPEPNAWLSLLTRAPRAMYLFAPSLR
jgi:protease-4